LGRDPTWGISDFVLRDKAIAATRRSFHKAGTLGGIAKRITDFVDRFIEPVIEIHESACGPAFFLKFLASYDLTVVHTRHRQHLKGLLLKPDSEAMLAQFAQLKIQLENSKMEWPAKLIAVLHEDICNLVIRVADPGIEQRRTEVRPCLARLISIDCDGDWGGFSYCAGCPCHRQGDLRSGCGRLSI
jgi:hypothetical protein